MLRHALQSVQGVQLYLPRARALRPSVEALEKRWERFRGLGLDVLGEEVRMPLGVQVVGLHV